MGVLGSILGGALVVHGLFSLYKDLPKATSCTANCGGEWAKVGFDMLEIAGGAMALMSNMGNESDTRSGPEMPTMPGGGGAPGGGMPAPSDIPNLCAQMPQACKVDPNTNRPQLSLPPKSTMRAALAKSFNGQAVNPMGLSLEEALTDLDDKYDQAADAIAAFNNASDSGAFDTAMSGEDLGTTAQADGDAGTGEGLNKGRGISGNGAAPNFDALTLPTGETMDWNALLNKTKAERGPLSRANAVGMNLQDGKSGRVLSLWERVSRAIRGTRDRDILLAKVEWSRKRAMNKQGTKKPNFAVSTEKN